MEQGSRLFVSPASSYSNKLQREGVPLRLATFERHFEPFVLQSHDLYDPYDFLEPNRPMEPHDDPARRFAKHA